MLDKLIPTELRLLIAFLVVAWLGYQLFDYGRDVESKSCALVNADQAVQTSEGHRAEEQATNQKRSEASDEQVDRIRALQADLAAAAATSDRLRQQIDRTVRVAQGCSKGDPASEQSGKAVQALGAALGACTAEYREMGADAAERYSTGLRCEDEYNALSVKGTPVTSEKGSDK